VLVPHVRRYQGAGQLLNTHQLPPSQTRVLSEEPHEDVEDIYRLHPDYWLLPAALYTTRACATVCTLMQNTTCTPPELLFTACTLLTPLP
jgi:hypothetical protein